MTHKSQMSICSTLLLLLLSCALPSSGSATDSPQKLTFLTTADLQGHLQGSKHSFSSGGNEPIQVVGGIDRIATIINRIREESNHPVITVSAGDDLMGRLYHYFDGHAIVELVGLAGYDVFAPGNHEFDRGPGLLGEALGKSTFTSLCSDLEVKGTAMEGSCRPSVVHDYNGVRVGFFSLMTPEFNSITRSGDVILRGSTKAVAREMIAALHRRGVDLIVAVTHLGVRLDRKVAAEVEGIDIIIGGHSHGYLPDLITVGKTLIVNGGKKGSAVVRLDLPLSKNKKARIGAATYSLIPVTAAVEKNLAVSKRLDFYNDQLPKATVLGSSDTPWNLSKGSLRSGESAVADMINDLILTKFKVDVVLNNGGAFRGNSTYPAGPVTDTMLRDIDGFENDIYLLRLKGKYLQRIMEHSVASFGSGGFLQIAGMKLRSPPPAAGQKAMESGSSPAQVKGEISIRIMNKDGSYSPLLPEKGYRIATNAFLAERGGNGYYWFKKYGTQQRNTYTTLYSIMAMAITRTKNLSPSGSDGRIKLEGNK